MWHLAGLTSTLQGAEEFREAKRKRQQPHADSSDAPAKRVRGVAFGSGAGDEVQLLVFEQ